MKKKVSALVKQIIAAVSSIAKNKTLALKSKTRAIKTRIIIFSLLNKRFVMSSVSHKLHALLGQQQQQHHYPESDDDHHQEEDQDQSKRKALALVGNPSSSKNDIINVVVSHRSHQHQPVDLIINPTDDDHIHMTADSEDNIDIDDDIDHGYLHHLVEAQAQAQAGDHHLDVDRYCEEEDQFESVIDIVKNSKQQAGQEFSLEDDIDHVADLFIRRFHRQITIQKQHSFKSKRHQ